jgi:predicted amidohydrolase YtcJ
MLRPVFCFFFAFLCCVGILASSRVIDRTAKSNPLNTASEDSASAAEAPADLILTNARILTMKDGDRAWATELAIRGEFIVAVSCHSDTNFTKSTETKKWIGPRTHVIDLHGQFVMPGFNDAHLHLASAAYAQLQVDVEGSKTLAEFQQRIRDRQKDYKPGEWIIAIGWDHTLWPEKKFPTRHDLDAVSTSNPIVAGRIDGHVAAANSMALQLAGITAQTPDPAGGHIERDPTTGDATGMLDEDAAMDLVYKLVPSYSESKRASAFETLFNHIAQFGVTSVQDNSVLSDADAGNFGWENFVVYRQLQRGGKLNIRITEWLPFEASLARLEQMRRDGGTTDPWLKTGALKEVLDGSLGARTAAMLAPYSDDSQALGILRIPPEQLKSMAIERDTAGFQLAFHAIGDRTNRIALDTFAAVLAANGPRDRRDRVEHAQVVAPDDFARFSKMSIIASMQPSHLLNDERWATDRIGPGRALGAYAWHTMEKAGVHLAFGTDFPVEAINPLRGIYACVTRELPQGGPTGGWQPQEKLKMRDCLDDYTVGSAYAEYTEKTKGKIAPGMLADLVVFPQDLNAIAPADLLNLPVTMTIAGGRIVYQNSLASGPH